MPKKPRAKAAKPVAGAPLPSPQAGQAPEPEVRSIHVEEFVRRLRTEAGVEKRFAFFLGAGCSVTSGIPAAGALVRDHWIPRLRNLREPGRTDLDAWAQEQIQDYDPANPANSYGDLIDKLFLTEHDRQQEIENLCERQTPSFGYAVLAQLLARDGGGFNVVLTTNFDDLIADALYLYTEARPLVIHHEALASYIRPMRTRPLVVKLHGDHRLSPRNTALETGTLAQEFQKRAADVLHDRGIIFIGYGGADVGILKMLNALSAEALPLGAYWVHPEEPRGPIRDWLARRQGVWVRSGWFDEVMLLIRNEFSLSHPGPERFNRIFEEYGKKFQELSTAIQKKPGDEAGAKALKKAVTNTAASLPDDWKALIEADRAENEQPDLADEIYRKGITRYPEFAPLLGSYAFFLHRVRKQDDTADTMYKRALEADPKNAAHLGSYAIFLAENRKDHAAAQETFKRALDADPKNANILGGYADFLANHRKDHAAAQETFRRALDADPKNANILGGYANFLTNHRKDHVVAEEMYKRAIKADPNNATTLSNYANFLANHRKDHAAAEEMHKRSLDADPKNADTLGNYAGFLLAQGRKDGLAALHKAIAALKGEASPFELECAFYLFAHGSPKERMDGLRAVRELIESGVRSPGWDLSQNIERARSDSHPEEAWLDKLAAVVNGEAEPAVLSDWPAWKSAGPALPKNSQT